MIVMSANVVGAAAGFVLALAVVVLIVSERKARVVSLRSWQIVGALAIVSAALRALQLFSTGT